MKAQEFEKELAAGIRIRRLAAWVGASMLVWATMSSALADEGALSMVALQVFENAAGGVDVEWLGSAEPVPMLGWHVERQLPEGGVVRVTDARVDAEMFAGPSRRYRIHDAAAAARVGDVVSYRLVAIDLELRERASPFESYVVAGAVVPAEQPKAQRTPAAPARRAASPSGEGARVRIEVATDGLYRLAAGQIAAALAGLDEAQVVQAIAQHNLALSCGGEPVAWRAEAGGGALLFFGQAYRDAYADRNVYFLTAGPGLAMESADRATTAVGAEAWFWETVRAEQNLFFAPQAPGGVPDDYFMWAGRNVTAPAASGQWTTTVALPDLHPDMPQGTVTAHLVGGYNGAAALDNHTRLWAAGQLLDDRLWAGNVRIAQSGTATRFADEQVAVAVELRRETNVTTTVVLVDALDVRYARRLRARNEQLLFQPEAGADVLTVRGFSTAAIQVLDVTEPRRPVAIAATLAPEADSTWRASWRVDAASACRFLAVAAVSQPERIDGVADAKWLGTQNGAPHLVIAPQALAAAAAALVAYRNQQGLGSLLVPLEEIYDDFAFGRRDPRAIPRFLAHAQAQWTIPPAYVCLAGDGHLDYHDVFGQAQTRPNHVPPMLDRLYQYNAQLGSMLITLGLDNPLADVDGDGDPDVVIGRLPAQTPAALTLMINRIQMHEASNGWKNKVLMVSDRDSANAFQLACNRLASRVPAGMAVRQVSRTSGTTTESMRTNFIESFNASVPVAVYVGHANNTGLDSSYFFMHNASQSLMGTLTNQARTSLLLAGACMLNDFAQPDPSSRCIGKGFLDSAPGGAVAVWGTAMENNLGMAEGTIGAVLDDLFENHDARLGDMIRAALDFQTRSATPWMVRASVLMGDPGMRIQTHLDEPLSLAPAAVALCAAGAESRTLAVTAEDSWTAVANPAWIALAGGHSGSGNGTVTFSVAENAGTARTGSIVVSGGGTIRTCQIVQAAAPAVLTLAAEPAEGGSLAGAGTYTVGQQAWISAAAQPGWTFAGWSDGGMQNPRRITACAGGATYVANFARQLALLSVERNPAAGGTTKGGGTAIVGQTVEISATANEGWTFAGWSDGCQQNPRTVAVPVGGASYVADFEPIEGMWPLASVEVVDRRPPFFWEPTPGATWHQIWISRNGRSYETRWVPGSATWAPTRDFQGGEYKWWVRPWGPGIGMGPWSEPAQFTLQTSAPAQSTQIAPKGPQATHDLAYRWQKDSNATWYRLWVGRTGAGTWHDRWFELAGTGEALVNPGSAYPGPAKPIQTAPKGAIETPSPTFQWAGGACEWWLQGWGPDGYGPWSGPMAFSVPHPQETWYRVYVVQGAAKVLDQWVQDTALPTATTFSAGNHSWWLGVWDARQNRTIWSDRMDFAVQ